MNPQIEAALIAGVVSLISLGGTVLVALRGFQATKSTTKETLEAQREQLERTLAEQHVRTLNDRFATATEKLGLDKPPTVRLAGVYAMAGLADDWKDNRQACIEVLSGYLRMPYAQEPGAGENARLGFLTDREVRHTVIRVVTAHLREGAKVSWQGRNFDFTGVVFDGGSFRGAKFSGSGVDFVGAEFSSGRVDFGEAEFSSGKVAFGGAKFSGGDVDFRGASFAGGEVDFGLAEFTGGEVNFSGAKFWGGKVDFTGAEFYDSRVAFTGAEFSGGAVAFRRANFSGGAVDFSWASFSAGEVDFTGAEFSGGAVAFRGTSFSGGEVAFSGASFSGGEVDFSGATDWSRSPNFDWHGPPPAWVKLPAAADGSEPR